MNGRRAAAKEPLRVVGIVTAVAATVTASS